MVILPGILSSAATNVHREAVLNKFGGLHQFIAYHQQPVELKSKELIE